MLHLLNAIEGEKSHLIVIDSKYESTEINGKYLGNVLDEKYLQSTKYFFESTYKCFSKILFIYFT